MGKLIMLALTIFVLSCAETETGSPTSTVETIDSSGNGGITTTTDTSTTSPKITNQVVDSILGSLGLSDDEELNTILDEVEIVTGSEAIEGNYVMSEFYSSNDSDTGPNDESNVYVSITGNQLIVLVYFDGMYYLDEHATLIFNANGTVDVQSQMHENGDKDAMTSMFMRNDTLLVMDQAENMMVLMTFIPTIVKLPTDLSMLDTLDHDSPDSSYIDSTYYNDSNYYDSTYFDPYYNDSNYTNDSSYYYEYSESIIEDEWKTEATMAYLPNGTYTFGTVTYQDIEYDEFSNTIDTYTYEETNDPNTYLVFDSYNATVMFIMSQTDDAGNIQYFSNGADNVSVDGSILIASNDFETTYIHVLSQTNDKITYETIREYYSKSSTGTQYLSYVEKEKGELIISSIVIDMSNVIQSTN